MRNPTVVHDINFNACPKAGTILMKEGQRYELIALEPYMRSDGKMTTLLVWASHCAETGHPFQIKTGLKTKAINRRCPQHSNPGVAVSKGGRDRQRKRFTRKKSPSRRASR